MRILWQNEHYPDAVKGGGGAVNTYYIVRAMQTLGHEPTILARGADGGELEHEDVNGTSVLRLPAPRLPAPLWPVWPLLEPRSVRSAVARVAAPFQAFVCVDAAYAISLKRLYPQRPVVYRVEGTDKGHALSAPPAPAAAPSFQARRRRLWTRLLGVENELMDRLAWRRANALVVKSEFMKRDLVSLYGVSADVIHVIPNGVDFDRYATARPGRPVMAQLAKPNPRDIVITFAGRLVRMKNVPFLLAAFAAMRERERCVLALVGDGDQRAALEAEAQRLGVAARVRFVGHSDRVHELLAASDVFVLPSTYEPFGNALIEAMAAGLPCVALRPDGPTVRLATAEIMDDGATGFLVASGDPGELAARLDDLARDGALRERFGAAGQGRCRELYNWERCARGYLELLGAADREASATGRTR